MERIVKIVASVIVSSICSPKKWRGAFNEGISARPETRVGTTVTQLNTLVR
jgi:hypothetical protein